MPTWMLHWVLPLVLQVMTPFATQAVKNGISWLKVKLPDSVIVVLTGTLGEAVNQMQGWLTGGHLPPGASGLISVLINEAITDLSHQEQMPSPVAPDPTVLPTGTKQEPSLTGALGR